jgi:ABC-type antimicrobial peptide transport system permease subunit
MIFFEGMRLTMIGLMAGTLFAFGATRLMVSLLYRTVTTDPLTFSAVALVLVVVSAIACLLPAWRAANVDPMVALRSE